MTELPFVMFNNGERVDAASAVYVDLQPGDEWVIHVRHPEGGFVQIAYYDHESDAELVAAGLRNVMGAWARFSQGNGFER